MKKTLQLLLITVLLSACHDSDYYISNMKAPVTVVAVDEAHETVTLIDSVGSVLNLGHSGSGNVDEIARSLIKSGYKRGDTIKRH